MGVFFEREIEQVSTRERYINEVVANVDNTLRKSFEAIAESTANSVSELRNNSIAEFDALLKHYENQKNEFSRMLQEQNEDLIKRNEDLTEFIREIRSLADVKNTMSDLVESTKKQTSILEKIVDSLKHQKNVVHSPNEVSSDNLEALKFPTFPKSIIIMMSIITFLVFIALGIYIYNFLLSNNIINNLISA
jgi:predicted nuclease with TOPRIM domain